MISIFLQKNITFSKSQDSINSETSIGSIEGNFCYNFKGENTGDFFGGKCDGKAVLFPIFALNETSNLNILTRLVKEDLIPVDLPSNSKKYFNILCNCYKAMPRSLRGLEIDIDMVKNSVGLFDLESIKQNYIDNQPIDIPEFSKTKTEKIIKELLDCDKKRIDLTSYELKMLTDPNRGHWDLSELVINGDYYFNLGQTLFARPPQMDVKTNGIIGIDFGTKSTIVMYQDQSDRVLPIPIGTGNLLANLTSKHYEIPTALNFINLEKFIEDYSQSTGRPNTLWEDLTTSHTAFNSMITESSSDSYYSFLHELKQWVGSKNKSVRIQDKNDYTIVLNDYLNLSDNEFDPIEIYAYFIGLYINNMHNNSGSIYLKYILSYPATYEKDICDKLVLSFSKGIKKSLPKAILDDHNLMKNFSVQIGASEPVAYAVCAMEQFGFDPCDDDKIYYDVFDFGGGTTDFNFGIFREANDDDGERYDYVVESFGDSGDRTLGGENLLELIAFYVLKIIYPILKKLKDLMVIFLLFYQKMLLKLQV